MMQCLKDKYNDLLKEYSDCTTAEAIGLTIGLFMFGVFWVTVFGIIAFFLFMVVVGIALAAPWVLTALGIAFILAAVVAVVLKKLGDKKYSNNR